MQPGIQKRIWAEGAGDDWLERNRATLGQRDVASDAIAALNLQPKSVLEVGCSNGWRLHKMKEKYGCKVAGIDVAHKATIEAQESGLDVRMAGADRLPFSANTFDMVIYGYCLCFISPEDYLPLVYECDRVLQEGGHVVVYDFVGTEYVKRRMMNIMGGEIEKTPVYLYNYDWRKLWTGHPAYGVRVNMFNLTLGETCAIIQKNYDHLLVDFNEKGEVMS